VQTTELSLCTLIYYAHDVCMYINCADNRVVSLHTHLLCTWRAPAHFDHREMALYIISVVSVCLSVRR